jgi:hypothetical protein
VDWIHLARDRDLREVSVSTALGLWLSWKIRNSLIGWATVARSYRTVLRVLVGLIGCLSWADRLWLSCAWGSYRTVLRMLVGLIGCLSWADRLWLSCVWGCTCWGPVPLSFCTHVPCLGSAPVATIIWTFSCPARIELFQNRWNLMLAHSVKIWLIASAVTGSCCAEFTCDSSRPLLRECIYRRESCRGTQITRFDSRTRLSSGRPLLGDYNFSFPLHPGRQAGFGLSAAPPTLGLVSSYGELIVRVTQLRALRFPQRRHFPHKRSVTGAAVIGSVMMQCSYPEVARFETRLNYCLSSIVLFVSPIWRILL